MKIVRELKIYFSGITPIFKKKNPFVKIYMWPPYYSRRLKTACFCLKVKITKL